MSFSPEEGFILSRINGSADIASIVKISPLSELDSLLVFWKLSQSGQISLQDGLSQSCDVVFYDVGLALQNADPQLLPDWARAFGLGTVTGISGVEEAAGLVPDPAWKLAQKAESWFPGDTVNLAIGQSYLLATPLQIWLEGIAER